MKPASFEYFAPKTMAEALEKIGQVGDDGGKILAGGQSLIPAMNFRLAQPASLVDLNSVSELFYIKPGTDGSVLVGSMTRDTTVEFDPTIAKLAPMVQECLPFLAHPAIRNRGTFGGALAHGDPAGQLPVVAVAMNFGMKINKTGSDRTVPADEFYTSMYSNVMESDEILTEISIPKLSGRTGTSYKQTARQTGASALVGTAAVITLDDNDVCSVARVAFMGVSEIPVLSSEINSRLVGQKLTPELITSAIDACVENELDPGSDIHATPAFRRHLARVLGVDAVTTAYAKAKK